MFAETFYTNSSATDKRRHINTTSYIKFHRVLNTLTIDIKYLSLHREIQNK